MTEEQAVRLATEFTQAWADRERVAGRTITADNFEEALERFTISAAWHAAEKDLPEELESIFIRTAYLNFKNELRQHFVAVKKGNWVH